MAGQELDRLLIESEIEHLVDHGSVQMEVDQKLRALKERSLGRAFVYKPKDQNFEIILGYSLPLNREQTEHVVILNNGLMLITEPRGEENNTNYKREFEPSGVPFSFSTQDAAMIERYFMTSSALSSSVKMSSRNLDQQMAIQERLGVAFSLAVDLKAEREEAMRKSARIVIGSLGAMLELLEAPDADDREELDS